MKYYDKLIFDLSKEGRQGYSLPANKWQTSLSELPAGLLREQEPQLPQDYVALSCYCERHPDSPFIIEEMFSLKTDTGLIALDGHIYKELVDGKVTVRTLTDEEMPEAYAKFGLKY